MYIFLYIMLELCEPPEPARRTYDTLLATENSKPCGLNLVIRTCEIKWNDRGILIMNAQKEIVVLDDNYIFSISEIMQENIMDIVVAFIQTMPDKTDELKLSNLKGDLDAVKKITHEIKDAGCNIGAKYLIGACEELEEVLRENMIDDPTEYVNVIESILFITIGELKKRFSLS